MENTSKNSNDLEQQFMNDVKFLEWAAEEKQNALALFILASKFYNGDGVVQDREKAISYFRRSAEMGNIESAQVIAIAYRDKQDYEESVKWFLVAANAGLPDSMYSLFMRYSLGQGVQRDIDEAMKWLKKAADSGHAASQRILSESYYYGDNGLPEDKGLAFQYALQAAKQNDAEAAYCVALAYLDGYVVDKDKEQATFWLRNAANLNYPDAQLALARALLREKTENSIKEAKGWLSRGAALGNSDCQKGLELIGEMEKLGLSLSNF